MRAGRDSFPLLLFSAVVILGSLCLAQQPGTNVNVLPSYGPPDKTNPFLGDGYLQRQVEPVIAASSRNPDHLLAAFGDFRVVDLATGSPPANATEAWIGLSRSYNRGRTWFGSMVSGFPGDTSLAGRKSPLYGLSAGGDPVLASATNGRFYVGGVFFDRGGMSNIGVMQYQDIPDKDGGDNIRYQRTFVIDKGSVSATGNFDDKPVIAADIARKATNADACGSVYIAYTIFNGNQQSGGWKSKLGFSRSKEGKCGTGWEVPKYLNKTYPQNQGAAIAVDPKSGKVYVVWRHFKTPGGLYPDALLMVTSSDFGATFSDPIVITPSPSFRPYDQLDNSTDEGPPAFRTNAFPTVAVDSDGNVYVAVQEKFGTVSGPRIVIRTSKNGGKTWTTGSAVEFGKDSSGKNDDYAYQVLPVLSFGGGQLRLMWYDFRFAMQGLDAVGKSESLGAKGFISDMGRLMNVRLAQSNPGANGKLVFTDKGDPRFEASVPVSQYFIDTQSGHIPKVPTSKIADMRAINRSNLPMYSGGKYAFISDYVGLMPALRFVRSGPKDPEYLKGLPWRWAYKSTDYGAKSSYGIWYDTRDVIDPLDGDWTKYNPPGTGNVSCFNPGSRNGNVYFSEINPGIVVGSPALSRQLVDAAGKPIQRAFPFYVENPNPPAAITTNNPYGSRFFRLTINAPNLIGSFYQFDDTKLTAYVEILPLSSTTGTVYVKCAAASCTNRFAPFTLMAEEITGPIIDPASGTDCNETSPSCIPIPGGLTGSITFNADPTSPDVANIDLNQKDLRNTETHGAQVSSPVYSNPQHANEPYANPQHANPQHSNPQHANPQHANLLDADAAPVGDFTWTVTNAGNNASAYTSLTYITNPPQGYTYQLILSRTYKTPIAGSNCSTAEKGQDQVISMIPQYNPQHANPQHANPQHANPQYANPQHANPQHSNATFSLAPVSAVPSSSAMSAQVRTSAASSEPVPDDTIRAPLSPDEVKITLRVFAPWPAPNQPGTAPAPLCTVNCATDPLVTEWLERISQVVYPEAVDTEDALGGSTEPIPASSKGFTTTTITSDGPDPSVVGEPYVVSFAVAVVPPGVGTPTGSVIVSDGENWCSATLPTNNCQLISTSVGTKTLTATYMGDSFFNFSTGGAQHQVGQPVLLVPAQYGTIQAAIDAALAGDLVSVAAGTYSGPGNVALDFHGKAIQVKSASTPQDTIIDCQGDALAFYFHNSETPASVVQGFTIQNCTGGSVNWSPVPGGPVTAGGAILCDASNPTIVGNVLVDNNAQLGGAMACFDSPNVQVIDNRFFTNRTTGYHGGAIYYSNSGGLIAHNTFYRNLSADHGGAIGLQLNSSPVLDANVIRENSAIGGGGMMISNGSPRLVNNALVLNSATGTVNGPDIWYAGGALSLWGVGGFQSVNNTYLGNTSNVRGGAVEVAYTNSATFVNDIFWGNTAPQGNGLYVAYRQASTNFASTVNVDHSISTDHFVEAPSTLNLTAVVQGNPLFLLSNDWHLGAGSPCIDSGTSSLTGVSFPSADIDGDFRPQGSGIDLGADEYSSGPSLPDLIISSIDSLPASIQPGGTGQVCYTVRNIGSEGPSGNSTFDVAMYLSQDATLDPSDIELPWGYSAWTYHLSVAWSSGVCDSVWFVDARGNPITPGTYYLIVVADAKPGQPPNYYPGVVESNESNNWTASTTTITVVNPLQ